MSGGFRWCPHCGKPHDLDARVCPKTSQPLERVIHRRNAVASLTTASSPLLGTVLDGKYRILKPIGAGGTSIVFEAENLTLKRLVAIKVATKLGSKASTARLVREAMLVAAVHHPNICDVYDVGRLPTGGPYVVLERLFGETLAVNMKTLLKPSPRAVVELFAQILSALDKAHAASIIHRDLKPENVFLAERLGCPPVVKILDFGFARDLGRSGHERLTNPGHICGTPAYMSPEQTRSFSVDHRSDLFAVGVMLYEMLSGRHPFAGATPADVATNIQTLEPRPLRSRRPDLSRGLERAIMSALAKDPRERPISAHAMQSALIAGMPADPPAMDETTGVGTGVLWIPPRRKDV